MASSKDKNHGINIVWGEWGCDLYVKRPCASWCPHNFGQDCLKNSHKIQNDFLAH